MTRRSWCAAALVILLTAPVSAQSPTSVGVRAEIVADRYRVAFGDTTAAVEDSLAHLLARSLQRRIGFVRFAPLDSTSHRLIFTLDRRDRTASGPFAEYGVWARLERPDADPIELYWLPVRASDMVAQGIGSWRDFLPDVERKLSEPGPSAIIRDEFMNRVPIATEALPWSQPAGWALPVDRGSLCMRAFSEIEVIHAITVGAMQVDRSDTARVVSDPFTVAAPGPREQPFLQKLFGTPISEEARLQLIAAVGNDAARVKEVYVVKYQHDPNACERPIPPPISGGG